MLNRNTRLSEGNSLRVSISGNTPQRPSGQQQGKQEEEVEEEQLRTLWCGGISEKVDEEILYELFLNAGPLERVVIPKDRETKKQKNFAFIVFQHEETTNFAYELLNGTELFNQAIRLQNKATGLGKIMALTGNTLNHKDHTLQALAVVVIIREQVVLDITDLSPLLHSINNLARWELPTGLGGF